MTAPTVQASSSKARGTRVHQYTGEVVYLYAFDVAYEMSREPIRQLLGESMAQFSMDASKRNPKHLSFYKPQMVTLPPHERLGPNGPVRVQRTVKLLPVGAISISMRVPFAVQQIEDLVVYHDLQFSNGSLYVEVRNLAEEVRRELSEYFIRPAAQLVEEEAYTVFCLQGPLTSPDGTVLCAEDWLLNNRRSVAALLTQESDISQLSDQETSESTGRYLSYYDDDLVVIDWDAALIVDEPTQFEETVYIMELANLQLAELEAYDGLLDEALVRAYRDVRAPLRRRGNVFRELREIRIDLARFSDELSNITKFFGDWHLARIYQNMSARFHLGEWHHAVDEKLKALDNLYQILKHEETNRWMLILEATIVLLFIIDLILLVLGLQK
jgi:hypothetical protein